MIKKQIGYPASFKDADIKQGIITGYLSRFGNKDSDGDVIQFGAYTKTIKESGPSSKNPRIKYLQDHNTTKCVGVFTILKEDEIGLYYEAKAGRHDDGRNYLLMCEDGIITEHSVGFQTVKQQKMEDYNSIQEIKLWEGSGLQTWGANSSTPITGVKSQEEIAEMMAKLGKALRHGSYTDEAMKDFQAKYDEIAMHLNQTKEAGKTAEAEKANPQRERILLKGMDWNTYQSLTEEQQECMDLCQTIEYKIKEVASACGVAQLNPLAKPHAEAILTHAIEQITHLENAEKAMMMGENYTESDAMPSMKANTEPLADTQPIVQKEDESLIDNLIKSLQNK